LQISKDNIIQGGDLPVTDFVFVRVPWSTLPITGSHIDTSDPPATVFSNPKDENNLSCDWDFYVTAKESWENIANIFDQRTGKLKDNDKFFIYSFNIGKLIEVDEIESVQYYPLELNQAHSQIFKEIGAHLAMKCFAQIVYPNLDSLQKEKFALRKEISKENSRIQSLKKNYENKPSDRLHNKIKKYQQDLDNLENRLLKITDNR